jgi:hypothetical protein
MVAANDSLPRLDSAMLETHQSRICIFFAVDYPARMGAELDVVADRITTGFTHQPIGLGPKAFEFRSNDPLRITTLKFDRLQFSVLGLDGWTKSVDDVEAMLRITTESLQLERFRRIGLKLVAFMPWKMSHKEMCDLVVQNALSDDINPIAGKIADIAIHLEGERDSFKYLLDFSPVTPVQARKIAAAMPGLTKFSDKDNAGMEAAEFLGLISDQPSLIFDVDLFKSDLAKGEAGQFIRNAYTLADLMASEIRALITSRPFSQGKMK